MDGWRIGDAAWRAWDRVSWAVRKRGVLGAARKVWARIRSDVLRRPDPWLGADLDARYERWIRERERPRARLREAPPAARLVVTVACTVHLGGEERLGETVASLRAQSHRAWQLVVVPLGGVPPSPAGPSDPRVEILAPSHDRAAALGLALGRARGELFATIDAGATLSPSALAALAEGAAGTDIDLVYSDEDELRPDGRRGSPALKPGWSPHLLEATDYVGRICATRTELAREAGGFRAGFEGAEEYDLLLRCAPRLRRVRHVAGVLYHGPTRVAHPAATRRAAEDAAARRGATVEELGPGRFRVREAIRGSPLVSIVIPTRDRVSLLRTCVESILGRSTYPNVEVLVVDNDSRDAEARAYLAALRSPCRVLRWPGAFNWAAINNAAARAAAGDVLLFLNNDVEVVTPGWIEAMLEHAQREDVGAVGAKLLYPDGTVQHAGVVLGIGGFADHAFRGLAGDAPGYLHLAELVRDCGAVTGACLMSRRAAFEAVGGFDERLRVAFNDIDYCLRVRDRSQLVVYTPHARLVHHESATRGAQHPRAEYVHMRRRWGAEILRGDPYYSPLLTLDREDFSLDP